MLLTLTTTHRPATDLGYLLHKHPERVFSFTLPVGRAQVFYPEANEERCTAALLVELDPVALSRGKAGQGSGAPLEPYVNDRPYAASSYLTAAVREAFGTAMSGRSKERQALADQALPFEVHLPALPSRGGPDLALRLFGPLGYQVDGRVWPLDPNFPEWGDSLYLDLKLSGCVPLKVLLAQLTLLIPVLDDAKHYFVTDEEIERLQRLGAGWLENHPERDLILKRSLKHQRDLLRLANAAFGQEEPIAVAAPLSLNAQRLAAVEAELATSGAIRVLDLGCGEGHLLRPLLANPQFREIVGMDVSPRELERARRYLRLDELPPVVRDRLKLIQGSLTYRDARLRGYDAAALVEVIEHLDEARLWTLERVVFGDARPGTVVVTTPNAEYNARYSFLGEGEARHQDHRFEWDRPTFRTWAERVGEAYGYSVIFKPVGEEDPELGSPTQMAVFTRQGP
ncbi:3' terminal RNA ribose 2'-O-methyltransferase Hen1 [Deinococcus irradiatisoli]|uniref:Small RNA 2'-O-methyltransferase n=1 Tax=Deinococcus irradiatisoli TaxID=2202254 RepID=A0A2Z3JAH0_9DEIO|nr:3' terminal RNA ribose 2'-O-methyltransferase Hen1 [Deinococcus irradiatisoli]AWN21992.1 3' terminal RNA ribose 2'-O-methyltransferase Hen1 [Deinococcus irradiatisoli]